MQLLLRDELIRVGHMCDTNKDVLVDEPFSKVLIERWIGFATP